MKLFAVSLERLPDVFAIEFIGVNLLDGHHVFSKVFEEVLVGGEGCHVGAHKHQSGVMSSTSLPRPGVVPVDRSV